MIWVSRAPQKTPAEADESNNLRIRSTTVFLGDYLDRGRVSRQVIYLLDCSRRSALTVSNEDSSPLSSLERYLQNITRFPIHSNLSFCFSDFLFVRPGIPIHRQQEDDLLWMRDEFLSWDRPFEKFVVHGHTPAPIPNIRSNRANIDTGAFATGRLTCMAIEGSPIIGLSGMRNWAQKADTRNFRYPKTRAECALQG